MSQILAAFNAPDSRREDDAADRPDEDLRGALRVSLQPPVRHRRLDARARKAYFKWFNEDHNDDQHRYDYREWFNRVNQQPRIAGNAPYLNQVRTAALATLTDAEKADAELAAILAAYQQPGPGRGRGGASRSCGPMTALDGGRALRHRPSEDTVTHGYIRHQRPDRC